MVLSLIVNMSTYQSKLVEKFDWYWASVIFLRSIKTDGDGWWKTTLQKLIVTALHDSWNRNLIDN